MSLPSWERGLKLYQRKKTTAATHVAPLVGAWIEIWIWETDSKRNNVAPLVGAWIEIHNEHPCSVRSRVAPLVGAWIEILRHG